MIAQLRGKLAQKDPARVVVDVNGVGYEVFVPLTTFTALPDAGSDVSIDIHTHVREDMIALYGFSTRRERLIFERLMTISGIGPKLAVTILSGGSVQDLVTAIKRGDLARLTAIPGVGKKTAERIILELRDKLQDFAEGPGLVRVDVRDETTLRRFHFDRRRWLRQQRVIVDDGRIAALRRDPLARLLERASRLQRVGESFVCRLRIELAGHHQDALALR